jgi:uncharacterized membrane protein
MTENHGRTAAISTWFDLLLVVGIALLTVAPVVFSGEPNALGPAQIPLGFVLVFFLPGYAVVAAFYPSPCFETETRAAYGAAQTEATSGPTALERLVVAIGLSVVTVPLVGIVWNFTPWGIAAPQVLGSLLVIVLVGATVAAYRRATRPAAERFRLPLERFSAYRSALTGDASRETTIAVAVTLLVVLSVVAVSTAIAVPKNGEEYTELYLLSEDPESGQLTAGNYPATLPPGEPREIHVGIGNRESVPVDYTVVVELQRLETVGEERIVVEEAELDRFTATVEAGERTRLGREVVADPGLTGSDLRLAFLLYEDTPPSEPSVSNAYREVHLWVSVPPE